MMKRILMIAGTTLVLSLCLGNSCEDEGVTDNAEESVDDATDATEDAIEDTGDSLEDAGEEVEDSTDN